ncbi:MAG: UDP-3-O-acyl-N-acetylglucosamine deacetylase [Elusimicrobiota bacterium]|nr:UDP-3-O-acyl-N-acetylglucosamine deacetylase [Elusimicrobiota bacterium]
MNRKTILNKTFLEGIGIHTGQPSKVTFLPQEKPLGIRFINLKDSSKLIIINANLENVKTTVRGTSIGKGTEIIHTVEHILSACAGLGIDDLDVEINSHEPPIMDGSALEFTKALLKARIKEKKEQPKYFLSFEKEFEFNEGKSYYKVKSCRGLKFKLKFTNKHKMVGTQIIEINLNDETYMKDVSPARTFGFKNEIDYLLKNGLALGGSLKNAIIIEDEQILSSTGKLRFNDEFARHKLLDLIGDLKLMGFDFKNIFIEAGYTGHKTNIDFAKLLKSKVTKIS